MKLAPNVVVHDPETEPAKIDSERLRAHGWPKIAVEYLEGDHADLWAPVADSSSRPAE